MPQFDEDTGVMEGMTMCCLDFDLTSAMAAGGKCFSINGYGPGSTGAPARIICTDRKGAYPVVALVAPTGWEEGAEVTACFKVNGEGTRGRHLAHRMPEQLAKPKPPVREKTVSLLHKNLLNKYARLAAKRVWR